jgi:mannose-6-phosphate isomerase-like protein (cupin superfamily)
MCTQPQPQYRVAFIDALKKLENSLEDAVTLYHHNGMRGVLFSPGESDTQEPHSQDEVYIVMCGSGELLYEDKIIAVDPGDFLFVPAGVWHRFINYTADLLMWAIFIPKPQQQL